MHDKQDTARDTRPGEDTIAGTGPGIPDDALAPGETELPTPPDAETVKAAARKLGAPEPDEER